MKLFVLQTFGKLQRLAKIDLSFNSISQLDPNTFTDAVDLTTLNISFNQITTVPNRPILNQPELEILNLEGCGLTEVYDETFSELGSLIELNLASNQLSDVSTDVHSVYVTNENYILIWNSLILQTVNVKAFEPIHKLSKLNIGTLTADNVFDLCSVLSAIDVVSTDKYHISCFELVSGSTFDESTVTNAPKPATETVQGKLMSDEMKIFNNTVHF